MQLFIILINAHPYIIGREQRYCFGNFQVELSGPKDFSVMVRFSSFYDLKAVTFYLGSAEPHKYIVTMRAIVNNLVLRPFLQHKTLVVHI